MNSTIIPSKIRFDHARPGTQVGFSNPTPSISWQVSGAPAHWIQHRAEIEIISNDLKSRPYTYFIEGDANLFVPWKARALTAGESARVRVRVQGDDTDWSDWSQSVFVECGLLDLSDWRGVPIYAMQAGREDPAPVLVRRFNVTGQVSCGRLYATAAGIYVAYIDGVRVGNEELAPGWTDYKSRFLSQTYDVTKLLTPGDHEIAFILGNGWYRGNLTWRNFTNFYGNDLWLLANLHFSDEQGHETIVTDEQWRWRSSNILSNDLYNGEIIDYRHPFLGARGEEHDISVLPKLDAKIEASQRPSAKIVKSLPAKQIITTPSGKCVIDFGQNISGRVRLKVRDGKSGDKVVLRHAEVLEHGELGVRPLRSALCTDIFILAGDGIETLEPVFSQHGFRYAEVNGTTIASLDDISALVISADVNALSEFECSNSLVTQLFENTRWSTIDNFISVPTDCPQRDERLGWTGDIGIFAPTALSLFAEDGLLISWLEDMAAEQGEHGEIPNVVPNVLAAPQLLCAWGDSAVLVPWALYWATGDVGVLRRFLPVMDAFVEGVRDLCSDNYLWQGGFQFGDWLDPDAPADRPGDAKANPDVVATAYFAHSSCILSRVHKIMGDEEKANYFARLAEHVEDAYRNAYVTDKGLIVSDCATVYAQALVWNLLKTEVQKRGAADRLADLVRISAFRVSTGFVGTPLICEALSIGGHSDLAARLLLQTKCPSWLYTVSMGATTMWERWDSMLPDGSINPGEMTSFNHYSLGAVTEWLLSRLAGLKVTSPGYRHIQVSPYIGPGFSSAKLDQETPYGKIHISWNKEGGNLTLQLEIPTGIEADVILPSKTLSGVSHGTYTWVSPLINEPSRDYRSMTVRDLLDSEDSMKRFIKLAREAGAPGYTGDDADVVLAHSLKPYIAETVARLPEVMGHPDPFNMDPIAVAAQSFVEKTGDSL